MWARGQNTNGLITTHLLLARVISHSSCFHVAEREAGRRVTRDANVTVESVAPEKTTGQQSSTVEPELLSTVKGRCCAAFKHLSSVPLLSLISFFLPFLVSATTSAKPRTYEATTPAGIFFS